MSVTAAKWIDSWARLQFRFFLNLFSCLLTTNLSRRNSRSRASLPKEWQQAVNPYYIPRVYSRYLAATKDVHSTAIGCKWLSFRFTTMMQRNQSAHTTWLICMQKCQHTNWLRRRQLTQTVQGVETECKNLNGLERCRFLSLNLFPWAHFTVMGWLSSPGKLYLPIHIQCWLILTTARYS